MCSAESRSEGDGPRRIHLNTCKWDLHPISRIPSPDTCYCPSISDYTRTITSPPLHQPAQSYPCIVPKSSQASRNITVCPKLLLNSQKNPAKTSVLCSNHLLFLTIPPGAGYHHGSERPRDHQCGKALGLSCLVSQRGGDGEPGAEVPAQGPPARLGSPCPRGLASFLPG